MKKIAIILSLFMVTITSIAKGQELSEFEKTFRKIEPKEIEYNIFKLLDDDWSVITSGPKTDYNSMIGSWGGFGIVYGSNVSWIFLNASRYTLEKVKTYQTYTLSYMDNNLYREEKMLLAAKSGRNSNKMSELKLAAIETPSGNMAYKESYLVIEQTVDSVTELNPDSFKDEKHKKALNSGKNSGNGTEYHNMIMGVITTVWVRK